MSKKREEQKESLSQLQVKEVKVKERKLVPKLVKGGARIFRLPAPKVLGNGSSRDPGEEASVNMERSKEVSVCAFSVFLC